MPGICPPIPEFLRVSKVQPLQRLRRDHPVARAADAQRKAGEGLLRPPPVRKRGPTEWVVFRVGVLTGKRRRLGTVKAVTEQAALRAAVRKFPDHVDEAQPSMGLTVEVKS
jgi:hypothetical protein